MLAQWHEKDLNPSARGAGWQVTAKHKYILDPESQGKLTMPSTQSVRPHQGNKLTCDSSGNPHTHVSARRAVVDGALA